MRKEKQYNDTEGAGGKGGSGGTPSQASDTLVTNEVIKILHLIGEGEVNLYTGDGQSIFLNNVPLVNSNGSYNFGAYNQATGDIGLYTGGGATAWEWRNGAPSQTPMTNPAFPSASAIVSVNAEATGGTAVPLVAASPVVYDVSHANVDYALVAINFPNGIVNVDSNGNIIGDSINITLDVKPHTSGTWVNVINTTIKAKSSASATIQYQVNNPVPGTLWDIRFSRVTPDNSSSVRQNACYLFNVEEVQQITLPYNGIAYCGLALSANTIGGSNASIPVMSFLVAAGPIPIPSNYNPATHVFTGTWDGTFTTGVTDDPAWILYNLLTNQQYGCYLYGVRAAMIDPWSFYNASVFNNVLVPDGSGGAGTEPRFTFNAPIQNRQDMYVSLQQVAGMMNATFGMQNGLITLFQDRPVSTPAYLVTKANVIGSDPAKPIYFTYTGNQLTDRTTAVNVTWTNASDLQYLPTTSSVTDATGLTRYGYNPTDLAAFGATTEGQALRAGRYQLFTALNNTETVVFKVGIPGFIYALYDVFALYDDDYAGRATGGRVVSATLNTVTLDQPVIIDGASPKVSVLLQDGVTYESHPVTNGPGTYSTLTISGSWSVVPAQYCLYGVTSAIAPRPFRIVDMKYDSVTKEVEVTANLYSAVNYNYVEQTGYVYVTPVYSAPTLLVPTTPTNLTATPGQYVDTTTYTVAYDITINWTPVAQAAGYVVSYRKDNGPYTVLPVNVETSYELRNTQNGTYNFLVSCVNIAGNSSAPATVSYTQNNTGGTASAVLAEITGLSVVGGGTAWTGLDCAFTWINPAINQGLLKSFIVTIKTVGGTLLRTVLVHGVPGGSAASYTYTFAMNQADNAGSPQRSLAITVQGVDSSNNTTTGDTATLTNAAPPIPSNIAASAGLQNIILYWTPDNSVDVAGYIVWLSTTNGFTPSSGNATDVGLMAMASFNNLAKTTTYYYRVAAYDVFGKSLAGTGLNVSGQLSIATPSNVGIQSGTTLPVSGMTTGDFFYDTANGRLYKYNGSAWVDVSGTPSGTVLPVSGMVTGDLFYDTANSTLYQYNGTTWVSVSGTPSGTTLPVSGMHTGDTFFDTTDNNMYQYDGSVWRPVGVVSVTSLPGTGAYTGQMLYDSATKVLSTWNGSAWVAAVAGSSLVVGSVTTSQIAAGTIVAANIASATITGSLIAAGTIAATNIAAGTITATQIATGTITATQIATGTITASLIAAGTITTSQIASATILGGNIAAGTITATNIYVAQLSAISADMGTITAGSISSVTISASYIYTGSFTSSWAWPVSGGGFLLCPTGLLMGNANTGGYLEIVANGDIYAPQFSIVGGSATFGGALSAASGTFAGSLSAATGTFAGNLSAAGGTFAGSISAATGTFSGSLGAGIVTTASIVTGNITTATINGNAVTIPTSASTSGSISCPNGSTTVQTITWTSVGSPTFVSFSSSLLVTVPIAGAGGVTINIMNGGTTLYSMTLDNVGASTTRNVPFGGSFQFTPGAGSITLTMVVVATLTGAATCAATNRSLFSLETKR
jgi:predicted phage tail protein